MSRWLPEPLTLVLGDGTGGSTAEAMLASLNDALERVAARRGTRVTCVIGGPAVRYRVVPWSDELSSPAERRILAAHAFHDAYGEAARSWAVREHSVRHGRATLACAIDATLLDSIEALCRARGLRLESVQPSLMHAFNRHRGRIDDDPAWFVWIEARWVTALLHSRGEAIHVRQLAASQVNVPAMLDREWFALALDASPCAAYVARSAAAAGDVGTPRHGFAGDSTHAWRIIDLPGATPDATATTPADTSSTPVPA